jgi:hypothetical protein
MGNTACLPGGSCPTCNPKPDYCQVCLKVVVENVKEPCDACAADLAADAAQDDGRDEPITGANYGEA